MKKKVYYLANVLVQNAATAVTYYYSFCKNSYAVNDCYYHYYYPVKGYTLSYDHRAISAVLFKRNMPCYSTILFQR